MLVTQEDIFSLIPQRPPIVMVDGLLEHSAEASTSVFHIAPDNIFVAEGAFQMPGLVENIAQTVALRAGYEHMVQLKAAGGAAIKAPVGFIGEIKNLQIHFLPAASSDLETRVQLLHKIFGASVVNGQVICDGKVAAECEMKLFVKGD